MWKRLKTKVLLKPPGSATRTSLLHHLSPCSSDTTDDHSELDDDPDLIRDSRKMSFPYLDKCSCGSPGLSAKDSTGGGVLRRTGSLRRKNTLVITEINRKNDGGRKESCETAKNEYTRPESVFDERRKGSTTSTPVMMSTTMPTTTTMMMTTTTTTTTTAATPTTISAGYTPTGPVRGDEERTMDSQIRVIGRKPSSVQRSSTGLDDSEEDSDDEDPQTSSESGSSAPQKQPQRESGGSSDYTSLAFDVNYVRVSPPKMTRRQKTVEASTKKGPSRGSLLSGTRSTTTATEVPPAAAAGGESEMRSGKQPPRDVEGLSDKSEGVADVTKSPLVVAHRGEKAEKILKVTTEEPNWKPVSIGPISRSAEKKSLGSAAKETEYISLHDLQLQIHGPTETPRPVAAPGNETKSKPLNNHSGSNTPKIPPGAASVVDLMEPLMDDPAGDSVTLFQDGDSSVLEFTFTVRLENDVIRRIRPEDSARPDSNTGSPVVSGCVNITKTDTSTLGLLKPVITVGLRNVTVDGVGTKATDHDACAGARKKLPEAETVSFRHTADRHQLLQQQHPSRDCVEGVSQIANSARSPLLMSDGGRTGKSYDATFGRPASDSRGPLAADGVKTVTWAFDRSSTAHTTAVVGGGFGHSYKAETSPKDSLDSERSPRKQQQTLADFISSHQTKITTVAIVHKPADFDDSTTDPGAENVGGATSRPSDRKQAAGSESPAASVQSNKSTPTEGGRRPGGRVASTQVVKEPELTHMSWEEVMKEAKALGIPLARPGSATRQQQQQLQHPPPSQQLQRRSSVSSTTADSAQMGVVVDAKMTSSWVCPTCPTCCPETTVTSATNSRRAAREAEKTKKGSPFRDKFKLQNLFCRKQKDDDGGKSTTNRSGCKAQQQNLPHQHLQHHHNQQQQQQHLFHTMPPSCAGRTTSSIEDSCCLRCVSASKGGGGGGGGGGHHHGNKTTLSPSRLQSPLRMSFFSGTAKKSVVNGGNDCSATVHRTGCQWNSPPGKNNNKGTVESQRENANSNSDSSTLSPKQKQGNNQDFLKSLDQLKNCGWYWGPLGFEEAEVRLSGKPNGAFLVRDSSDDRYILSLSFRSQGTTHHTRIEHFRGMFSFYAQQNIHEASTIVEFIENAMRHSQEGKCLYYLRPRSPSAAPAPVQLLYPVSRFLGVFSLKHLAQAAVLSHLRRPDLIDRLPLSTVEKESLRRQQHTRRQRAGP